MSMTALYRLFESFVVFSSELMQIIKNCIRGLLLLFHSVTTPRLDELSNAKFYGVYLPDRYGSLLPLFCVLYGLVFGLWLSVVRVLL